MVVFLALALFLVPYTLFNVGGSTPQSGLGDVVTKPAPAARQARLVIKAVQPVMVVAGTGFKPRESVRVTGATTMRVRASAAGSFSVRMRYTDPCNGLSITAVGSKGSRAVIQYSQLLCIEP